VYEIGKAIASASTFPNGVWEREEFLVYDLVIGGGEGGDYCHKFDLNSIFRL
jgi:hypothetical protein